MDTIRQIVMVSRASDAGVVDANSVVACDELDHVEGGTKYVVGLNLEMLRDLFPSAVFNISDRDTKFRESK